MCLTARFLPPSDASAQAPRGHRRRRSFSRPAPLPAGLAGSRFSVLAEESSSESCLSDQENPSSSSSPASPRSDPERITLDVRNLPAGAASPQRAVSSGLPSPLECRGGSPAALVLDLGLECFPALPSGPPRLGCCPSPPPRVLVGSLQVPLPSAGEALAGSVVPLAAASSSGSPVRRADGETTVVPGLAPGLVGLSGPTHTGPPSLAQPNCLRYKWVWTPVGSSQTLASLQFPASATDLRRSGIQPPPSRPAPMDRNRADRQSNKRPFEDEVPPAERRRELELRHRAEREHELRRQDWERERSPDRRYAGQSFRYDGAGRPAYNHDSRRFQEEGEFVPPRQQKSARHFKPRNPAPAASAPPPSTAGSSQVESIGVDPLAPKTKITCFNCSTPGHFQSNCTRPPHCVLCDVDGHTTGMCPNANRPTELKWFGFAIDGGAFYAFDCPPLESNPKHDNMAYVLAEATEEAINEGLKKLIDETWDFQVRKVADSEFAVLFPNADSLRLCKNATNLTLPVSKITVVVSEVRPAPKPSGRLQEVWVRLHDVPPPLLSSANLMAAMVMLGKPLIVDELSLSKDEPVLMKFHTPVPAKLRTTVNLSVHGEIFPIRVVPEPSKGSVSATDLPPPPHNDKDDQDDDEEEETEELSASDHNWKRQKAKSGDKSGAPSSNATSAGTKKTSLQIVTTAALQTVKKIRKKSGVKPSPALKAGTSECQAPLECPSPRSPVAKTLMPNSFDQYGSNLVLLQSPPECSPVGSMSFPQLSAPLSGNTPSSVIISSPEASSPALHLSPLKAAKLSAADREEVGWQSPIHWEFDNETLAIRCQKLKKKKELSQGSAPAQRKGFINLLAEISASAPASKAPRSAVVPSTPLAPVSASKSASIHSKTASSAGGLPATTPTSGSRRSTRAGGQTGEPVLQKAIRRAVEKETPAMATSCKK
ncbi:uncharacterized protein [Lolium perenne]|uniref:uncharacterized protein n=1 Tax=Lolium perenne TaxID=4522 RepID=UPI003A9A2180